ncbi:hypothetical protein [Chryseobacterium sp.]|uniref:hypothetical protein n=1 Tax=Chryseobacterium sp. TaxID=1871047 RepID=UPI00261DD743|nr:hypothetical protein [Chryseobacterium sp.]
MKKIIFTLLLTTSAMSFAKAEEPKVKTIFPKQERKVLIAKKTIQQEEKVVIKIAKAKIMNPFQECVFNNSMSISLMYLSMGIPTAEGFAEAVATGSCMASFGVF